MRVGPVGQKKCILERPNSSTQHDDGSARKQEQVTNLGKNKPQGFRHTTRAAERVRGILSGAQRHTDSLDPST